MTEKETYDLLIRAAEHLRKRVSTTDAEDMALAEWLTAEAHHFLHHSRQVAIVNMFILIADDHVNATVAMGYNTVDQAIRLARVILGEEEDDDGTQDPDREREAD